MKISKHTPGPWKTTGESTLNIISYAQPKGRKVCSLINQSDEDNANATLIAAAPEMFEVLEKLITAQQVNLNHNEIMLVNAILKKAKGE